MLMFFSQTFLKRYRNHFSVIYLSSTLHVLALALFTCDRYATQLLQLLLEYRTKEGSRTIFFPKCWHWKNWFDHHHHIREGFQKKTEKLCPFDKPGGRGEQERLFGSREREGKLKITFPFYGKGTGIRKLLREGKGNLRLVIPGIPGNPGNHRFTQSVIPPVYQAIGLPLSSTMSNKQEFLPELTPPHPKSSRWTVTLLNTPVVASFSLRFFFAQRSLYSSFRPYFLFLQKKVLNIDSILLLLLFLNV